MTRNNEVKNVLRTIVEHENRMTLAAIQKFHPTIHRRDLEALEDTKTLARVDGNWIVLEWWKA